MSALAEAASNYLRLRNRLGHELAEYHRLLPRFVAFLDDADLETVTVAAALAWVTAPDVDPSATVASHRMTIGDKNYYGAVFEADAAGAGVELLRRARKGERPRPGERFFKPLRQITESINDTLKGQLDLEAHGGRTIAGVCARIAQRILALTAAIWHNDTVGATIRRSLTAYDH
jgi:hypothetical protein